MAEPGPARRRRRIRWLLAALLALAAPGWSSGSAAGSDRTDVPLDNWGGFAVHRHVVYDDLERLAAGGLVDRALLSTKPLSRTEAARIVARAIENVRRDEANGYGDRRDLETVIDRLIDEFGPELAALGVRLGEPLPPPGPVVFVPVDRVRTRAGWSSEPFEFVSARGLRFEEGVNGAVSFDSRLQVGEILSLYVEPELQGNEDFLSARLKSGYLKLTLFNVELLAGRESLWWGPGYRGSLILSNNAPPLDHVRVGSAEPFRVPLLSRWLGPAKLLFFVARLEENREHPRAKLAGMRVAIAPFRFLELGLSRTTMFGGRRGPQPDLVDFLAILFNPPAGDDPSQPEERSNNVFAIDADLRIPNVDRFGLPARDLRLYGEFGWDDTCCSSSFIPLRDAISFLFGVQAVSVFGREGLEARMEYATSSAQSFRHHQFTDGYQTRGRVISHAMGTDGYDWSARASNRVTPNVMFGLELNRGETGSTLESFGGPKERRLGGGVDISWRFLEVYALFAEVKLFDVENRGFRAGDDGLEGVVRLELTRSFR